jgi:hypothetical protein
MTTMQIAMAHQGIVRMPTNLGHRHVNVKESGEKISKHNR